MSSVLFNRKSTWTIAMELTLTEISPQFFNIDSGGGGLGAKLPKTLPSGTVLVPKFLGRDDWQGSSSDQREGGGGGCKGKKLQSIGGNSSFKDAKRKEEEEAAVEAAEEVGRNAAEDASIREQAEKIRPPRGGVPNRRRKSTSESSTGLLRRRRPKSPATMLRWIVRLRLPGRERKPKALRGGDATRKAAWLDLKKTAPGGDKTAPTPGSIKLTPIDSGVSAEQGERLTKVFRLAKLLCSDGYKVQMHLPTKLGGKVIEVAGVQEASFIREILEQGKLTGGRMPTPEV